MDKNLKAEPGAESSPTDVTHVKEVRLRAVKAKAVIETALHELDDASRGLRRFLRVGFELDRSARGFQNDDRAGAGGLLLTKSRKNPEANEHEP